MEKGKIKPKRQIYIPDTIIRKLRLMEGDKIAVSREGGRIKLVKVRPDKRK